MASSVIHMAVASEVNKVLNKDKTKLMLGTIAPDISKTLGFSKKISHFVDPGDKYEAPSVSSFLSKYKKYLNDDFVLGYYMHLYVDFLWFKYFLTEIRDESEVTKLDGTKVNLKGNMFEMYLYSDYTNLNSQLFDLYDIDCKIFYMDLPEIPDIIKEIPMDRLNTIIEETGKIIEKTNERKEYIINIEHVKKFIETAVKFIISDLTILGIIKK